MIISRDPWHSIEINIVCYFHLFHAQKEGNIIHSAMHCHSEYSIHSKIVRSLHYYCYPPRRIYVSSTRREGHKMAFVNDLDREQGENRSRKKSAIKKSSSKSSKWHRIDLMILPLIIASFFPEMALWWISSDFGQRRGRSSAPKSTSSGSCQSFEAKTRAYIGYVLTHDEWIVCGPDLR